MEEEIPEEGVVQAPEPRSNAELVEAGMTGIGTFVLPSPFSARELTELEQELKGAMRQVGVRLAKIEERERTLDERDATPHGTPTRSSRISATSWRSTSSSFAAARKRSSATSRSPWNAKRRGWAEIAKFFESGDPKKLVSKLQQFTPAGSGQAVAQRRRRNRRRG